MEGSLLLRGVSGEFSFRLCVKQLPHRPFSPSRKRHQWKLMPKSPMLRIKVSHPFFHQYREKIAGKTKAL